MMRLLLICLLAPAVLALHGQNQVDEQGLKTGHWKVDYPNGKTRYEADFVEGKPVGEMIRYHKNGAVSARMQFTPLSERSYARMYYKSGKPAAEGWFDKQLKDSVWTYYSERDGSVRLREPYLTGKLEGTVQSYYPGGEVSEEVQWKQQVKEGPWKQYYENGIRRLEAQYKNDLLHGNYELYYSNEHIKMRGSYLENRSEGTWFFYNEEGKEIYAMEYLNGMPVDQEKYLEWIRDTLQNYGVVNEPGALEQ
jgi:antitoxin component YwqK of YwqJK toxin-antitoxin module